ADPTAIGERYRHKEDPMVPHQFRAALRTAGRFRPLYVVAAVLLLALQAAAQSTNLYSPVIVAVTGSASNGQVEMRPDGSGLTTIPTIPGLANQRDLSYNGLQGDRYWLAETTSGPGLVAYREDFDLSTQVQLTGATTASGGPGHWSPDSNHVAYVGQPINP